MWNGETQGVTKRCRLSCWPIAPLYMIPNVRGGGKLRDLLRQWVQLYSTAQINFEDRTPYLTYGEKGAKTTGKINWTEISRLAVVSLGQIFVPKQYTSIVVLWIRIRIDFLSAGSGSGSRWAKMTHKKKKKWRNLLFWSAGCSPFEGYRLLL